MNIDAAKFHKELRKRLDIMDEDIRIAELENKLSDVVAMKAAGFMIDVLAGAIAAAMVADPDDIIPWE